MKIPVSRAQQSRVVAPQEGFARAAPALDFSPITDTIKRFSDDLEKERKTYEAFDLNKRLLAETNALQADYMEREKGAPLGAAGFTQTVLEDYEKRHNAILDEYWKQGYSEEAINNFSLSLGSLRRSFGEKALLFQAGSLKGASKKGLEEQTLQASQYAANNLDGYTSVKEEMRLAWEQAPGFDAVEREDGLKQSLQIVRQGAARALAQQRADFVIQMLDPQGFTAPAAGGVTTAPGTAPRGAYDVLREFEGFRETPYWDVNHHRVGYGSDTITRADGSVVEVTPGMSVSREDADRDLQRRVGELTAKISAKAGAGWQQLGEGAQAAIVSVAYNYGDASERLDPLYAAAAAGDRERVAEIIESFQGDNDGVNRKRRLAEAELARASAPVMDASSLESVPLPPSSVPQAPDPATLAAPVQPKINGNLPLQITQVAANDDGTVSTVRTISVGTDAGEVLIPTVVGGKVVSDEEAIAHFNETGENFGTFQSVEDANAFGEWLHQQHDASLRTDVKANLGPAQHRTGNPILDDMTGAERLQVLAWARETQTKKTSQVQGAMDVVVSNAEAAVGTGQEYAGPKPTKDDFYKAYPNSLEAEQKWAVFEGALQTNQAMQRFKAASPETIARDVERLKPDPASPTFAVDQKLYTAAQEAQAAVLKARTEDPAAYVLSTFENISGLEGPEKYAAMSRAMDNLGIKNKSYLTKGQQLALGKEYATVPPVGKREFLQDLMRQMGPAVAGESLEEAARAFDSDLSPDVARDFTLLKLTAPNPNVFDEVQKGLELLKEDRARKLPPSAIDSAYLNNISPAIRSLGGKMSALINTAAEALYVQKGGGLNANGDVNNELYMVGLREALGGRGADRNTGIVDLSDNPKVTDLTILPPGTNKQQFENFIERVNNSDFARLAGEQPRDSTGGVLPLYKIQSEGVFVMQAPGLYGIKFGRNKWALNKNGERFIMRIAPETVR